MRSILFLLFLLVVAVGCGKDEMESPALQLVEVTAGDVSFNLNEAVNENIPVDRSISLVFSGRIDPATVTGGVKLLRENDPVSINTHLISDHTTIVVNSIGPLSTGTNYTILLTNDLKSTSGSTFPVTELHFKTVIGTLQLLQIHFQGSNATPTGRIENVSLDFAVDLEFSHSIDRASLEQATRLQGPNVPEMTFNYTDNDQKVKVTGNSPLMDLSRYQFEINNTLQGTEGEDFGGFSQEFYSKMDETPKFPQISDEELLTKVQEQTFRYFWDFAHENSGMARERNTSGNLVTVGGSGFGVMALIVGVERGFITRQEAVGRWSKIIDFLSQADRFHGAWPHWLNGNTGQTLPFSAKDNGGDLVETAFMIQGLLTVRAYLDGNDPTESALAEKISQLWEEVEWSWYTRGGQDVLYWHWSPEYEWDMNLPIKGYNESLIVYVLAAASPTYPIDKAVYDQGWASQGGMANGNQFYGYHLPLGYDYGGPLFFAHYSFLGLDPRNLSDRYANYWEQNVQHSLINQAHAIANPRGFVGYSEDCWGLTASDNHEGYSAHSPTNDKGVITPTAALSSFPYTPEASMRALNHFYYGLGDRIWGEYGFHDAFNITESWYADSFLAIDQGPIVLMIENHRTALLWDLFMTNEEVRSGLDKLDFNY